MKSGRLMVQPGSDRRAPVHPRAAAGLGSRSAEQDPRWPAVAARLALLRERRRRAVRIVDADCGAGGLLLHAVRHARRLGFTAIEGRGIDGSPALVRRACAAADCMCDPAIGITFEVADMLDAVRAEHDHPADILLCHCTANDRGRPSVGEALRRAGDMVIGDDTPDGAQGWAR